MPAKMRAKSSLRIGPGSIDALLYILQTLKIMALEVEDVPELVITSLNDSKHSNTSRHYSNEAVDIRSKNFPSIKSKLDFRLKFEKLLGLKFRVLLENPEVDNEHFHVQVKKGHAFP